MNTEFSKKLNNEIISRLKSDNLELVTETLNELGETGNSAYIPFLIELLHTTDQQEIKQRISRLLAELKHSDAIPLIIDAIRNKQYGNELHFLVSACWENGMDYRNYLSLFTDLVIEHDFIVAFEAHTVITNMSGKISNEIYEKESRKIKEAIVDAGEEKKQLLLDLLDFLPELEAGIEPQQF